MKYGVLLYSILLITPLLQVSFGMRKCPEKWIQNSKKFDETSHCEIDEDFDSEFQADRAKCPGDMDKLVVKKRESSEKYYKICKGVMTCMAQKDFVDHN